MFAEYVVRVSCFFAAPLPDSALFGELVPIYARISVKVHTCMRARLRAVSFFFWYDFNTVGTAPLFHIS